MTIDDAWKGEESWWLSTDLVCQSGDSVPTCGLLPPLPGGWDLWDEGEITHTVVLLIG